MHRTYEPHKPRQELTLKTEPSPQETVIQYARVAETPGERRGVRRHILFAFAVAIGIAIGWKLLHVLEIVYVSALFAVVLMPIVQRIQAFKIAGKTPSRPIAILLLLGTAVALLVLFLMLGLPPVARDIKQFSEDLPQRIPEAVAKIKHLPMADKFGLDSIAQKSQDLAAASASYILASAPKWAEHIFDVLTAIILCIYFMLEGEHAYSYALALLRPKSRERLDATMQTAEHRMSKWLLGQGALMLILGVCSTVAFGLLHVRYFVLLGVLMGLFNIIPVAGGVITIVLAAGVAALDGWAKMGGVLLFYAAYIQVENGYLTPRIMKTSVDLMGLSVLVALLIGTALAGITGALVAVPSAALVAVLMDEYMVQKDAEAQALAAEYQAPQPDAGISSN